MLLLPSLDIASRHFSGSNVLEPVLNFIGCFEENKTFLNQVQILHAILLKTHQQ